MKVNKYNFFFVMFVACNTHGGYEYKGGPFDSIMVTSTNMTIRPRAWGMVVPDADDRENPWATRPSGEYEEKNEVLVLTPGKRTGIFSHHQGYEFAPVVYKDGLNGFAIINTHDMRSFGHGITIYNRYVALSDTPVEVGGDDVEMIMREGRKWVKFEEHQQKMKALMEMWPPSPRALAAHAEGEEKKEERIIASVAAEPLSVITNDPPPIAGGGNAAVAEGGAAASPPSRLWLYIGGILLAFCAAFYFVWRKTEN